jgi:hypothetical protein
VPKVADFGLAKHLEGDAGQTPTGVAVGTPSYMAPEQAGACKDLTRAADVYSLGAILYELLTGRPPFLGDTPLGTMMDVLSKDPAQPRSLRPGLSRDLEAVCLKCLRKEPAQRYPSALDLADDLARWGRDKPTRVRPPGPARRALRFVRRNPGKCLTLLLLAAVMGTLAVAYFAHPKRRLEGGLRRLARGETVPWLGEDGPPLWSDCVVGRDQATFVRERGEPYTVNTLATALVEFVPEVPLPGYRVRARVQHADGAVVSRVGLFLGHRKFETPAGTEHYFWELSFCDRLPGGVRAPLSLDLRRVTVPPPEKNAHHRLAAGFPKPGVTDAPEGPAWHEVVVDVTPEGVRAWEDGRFRGEVKAATLKPLVRQWLARHGHAGLRADLLPSGGGLGLFVEGGTGQFRSVTIGPADRRE